VINNPQGVVSATVESGATLTLQSPFEVTNSTSTFTVASGGTLNCGTSTNIWGPGIFTVDSGGTLEIGSLAGIASSGVTGNITSAGTRTYSTGGNYIYDGTSSQVLGNGLPTTVHNLTLATGMTVSLSVTNSPGTDTPIYDATGTLTASGNIISYTVLGTKLIHGTYPVFAYGSFSGTFGTPTLAGGAGSYQTPTVNTAAAGGTEVALVTADSAPTATPVSVTEITGGSIKIPFTTLIAAGSDVDGDTLTISAMDTVTADSQPLATNGTTLANSTMVYVPATTTGDTFNYTPATAWAAR